jgi:hypothetical protein
MAVRLSNLRIGRALLPKNVIGKPIFRVAIVATASQFREFIVCVLITKGNYKYGVGMASSDKKFKLNFVKIDLGLKT